LQGGVVVAAAAAVAAAVVVMLTICIKKVINGTLSRNIRIKFQL
jgi:hypothetical protein